MLGNGLANIAAAIVIALAILWTGGKQNSAAPSTVSDEQIAEIYARAVGDIRNDIVVSCGEDGDGVSSPRRASADSF